MSIAKLKNEQFLTDSKGKKTHVVLRIEDYEHLIEELEDLEDIRSFELTKEKEDLIEWGEAKKKLDL